MDNEQGLKWIYLCFSALLIVGCILLLLKIRALQVKEDFQTQGLSEMTFDDEQKLALASEESLQEKAKMLSISNMKDASALITAQDITPVERTATFSQFNFTLEEPKEEEDETQLGSPAMIYTVGSKYVESCDNGQFRKPYFWFQLPKNKQVANFLLPALPDLSHNNCRYRIRHWRTAWTGDQEEYKVVKETQQQRGNPLDWLFVIQEKRKDYPTVRNDKHPLLTDVKELTLDNQPYYQGKVNTISGPEIYAKVCKDNVPAPVILPEGIFLVFKGYPVKQIDFVVNNVSQEVTSDSLGPLLQMFEERLTTENGMETLSYVPKSNTLPIYIYMRHFCGSAFLHRVLMINFSFGSELKVKSVNVGSFLQGTAKDITNRIPQFIKLRDVHTANIKAFEEQISREEKNLAEQYDNLANVQYPQAKQKHRQKIEERYNYYNRWLRYYYRGTYASALNSWRDRQIYYLEERYKKYYEDLDKTRDQYKLAIDRTYGTLLRAQKVEQDRYNNIIEQMNTMVTSIMKTILQEINKMLKTLKYDLTISTIDPNYKTMDDLYSMEDLDDKQQPIPGTAKLYIRIM